MLDNVKYIREHINDKEFKIDDTRFVIDITPGKDRRQSKTDDFTMVKTPGLMSDYASLAMSNQGANIVELGIFQGGSYALIDKLFSPRALLGVELDKAKKPVLDYVESRKDRLKVLYETSQTDKDIILANIEGDLDIVFDDASHLYEPTRDSFNFLFKRLKPGGTYYIEDWAWSHQVPSQKFDHPWMNRPAVTNFIFDLVASAGGHSPIASVNITKRAVTIRKAKGPLANLDWADLKLRGKKMNLI